ncbi:MAG: nickel pincer cofactor biosynthesis protein LarC [Clostridia bacterium]
MRVLYFDCFSGISGDMTLGALLDLGIDKQQFLDELKKINAEGYAIEFSRAKKNGIEGMNVEVVLHDHEHHEHHNDGNHHTHEHKREAHHEHEHRNLNDIEKIINESTLDENIKKLSKAMFTKVAQAEAKIHGTAIEHIHFHEVGALDSIVDIVGVAICIHILKIDKIMSSPLHDGTGFIKCQHGLIPIPAPATLEIMREASIPVYSTGIKSELVTPTGAAIIAALSEEFGSMPEMIVEKIGYGAGKRDMEIPNLLRVAVGELKKKDESHEVTVMETTIDDMTGEVSGYVMERLFSIGALDVFYTPIYMKKNRPAVKLTVICSHDKVDSVEHVILQETSTIGIRKYRTERVCMNREIVSLETPYGIVRVKVSTLDDIKKCAPEYEDCKKLAEINHIPLMNIYNFIASVMQE